MKNNNKIDVALAKCAHYEASSIRTTVGSLLDTIDCAAGRGDTVLVKPNLIAPTPPDFLPCTHPLVVRAVCEHFLDHGAHVRVGDSPTFSDAVTIAGKIGLTETLGDLPVKIVNLNRPKMVRLSFGGRILISRVALENDLVVSVSKLKAHHQFRITGAVKNVYGCVTGFAKPILHLLYGDRGQRFETMMLEIWENLPPALSVMDAITAMHVHGPVERGERYSLRLLAASRSAVALDCAIMSLLGLKPQDGPLWQRALELNLPGADIKDLTFPLESPEAFDAAGFKTPDHLFPLSFRPMKVAAHFIRRFLADRRRKADQEHLLRRRSLMESVGEDEQSKQ